MDIGNNKEKENRNRADLKIKKNTLWNFLALFIYKTILDLSYYFVISRVWNYEGYNLNFNFIKFIESYLLLFVIFILMPRKTRRISEIIVWLLVLFSYVPMLTVFALADEPRIYMYATTGFWILIFLLLMIMPQISFSFLKNIRSRTVYYYIFLFIGIVTLVLIYKYLGFSFNINLNRVYEIRDKYKELNIHFVFYFFNWVAYIINPAFFAIFLRKRKWFFVVLVILLQFSLFSVTGNKIYFLILPYIYALITLLQTSKPFFYTYLSISVIIIIGIFSYWLINDVWITGLSAERPLIKPALLSFQYYDFFSQHDFIYLSSTRIFRIFIKYPYQVDPPHLIGTVYYNDSRTNANNGILADAYMNFGFIGFILWPILLVIVLKLADYYSRHKDSSITFAIMGTAVLSFTNGYLLTALLTNGIIIGLLFLYLLPQQKDLIRRINI